MKTAIKEKDDLTRNKEFEEFFKKYSKLIYSVVTKYCSDRDSRQDVIQYVLTRFHKAFMEKDYDFDNYKVVFTIAKNATLVYFRKKEIPLAHISDEYWESIGEVSNAQFKFSMLKTILTEEQYELIYLLYVARLTLKQYSELKNITYGSAKYKYTEIVKILRHHLEGFVK